MQGGLCICFTLLPVKNDKVFLYGGVVPVSKERLHEILREQDLLPSSPHIPTIALKLHSNRGKLLNALPLDLMPSEQLDDRIGLGVFPLLECIGSMNPKFPEHDLVGLELSKLLRRTSPTNNSTQQINQPRRFCVRTSII